MILENDILNAKIVIVDDENISVKLLKDILEKGGYKDITTTQDPREVEDLYLSLRPDLLILDLNMPFMSGFDVMKQLKKIEQDDYLPILVLTNDENKEARIKALESGAKDFLNKPYDRVEVIKRIHNLLEVKLLHNAVINQNEILEDKVIKRTKDLYETQVEVVERLSRAVGYRDLETGMHIVRMSKYSECLAKSYGLNKQECELILRASPLHDIGKIGIPDSILQKPGKLTIEEWEVMKNHTTIGGEMLSNGNSIFIQKAKEIALSHHERWDGQGYPNGFKEDTIPLCGRICCICDVFDALTSKRPYKEPWGFDNAANEIKENGGKQFDPKLTALFIDNLSDIFIIKQQYDDNL